MIHVVSMIFSLGIEACGVNSIGHVMSCVVGVRFLALQRVRHPLDKQASVVQHFISHGIFAPGGEDPVGDPV